MAPRKTRKPPKNMRKGGQAGSASTGGGNAQPQISASGRFTSGGDKVETELSVFEMNAIVEKQLQVERRASETQKKYLQEKMAKKKGYKARMDALKKTYQRQFAESDALRKQIDAGGYREKTRGMLPSSTMKQEAKNAARLNARLRANAANRR